MKNMDYGHIGNAEKRYRSIVTEDMVKQIIRNLPFLSNFSMTTACVERLSLALKEYLTYVLQVCKHEHEQVALLTGSNSEVITKADIQRAIQRHPFILSAFPSLWIVCWMMWLLCCEWACEQGMEWMNERMKELIDGCRNRKQGRVRVVSERKKREWMNEWLIDWLIDRSIYSYIHSMYMDSYLATCSINIDEQTSIQ